VAHYQPLQKSDTAMNHTLGATGELILQTLGGMAMILSVVLLVLVQFIGKRPDLAEAV
jgi:hypothetical protein